MKRDLKSVENFINLNKGNLIVLESSPNIALSTFSLNMATNLALKLNSAVAIFSMEMSKEQLVNRMISSEAMVDIEKIRTLKVEDEDWTKLSKTMKYMSEANIYIDDTMEILITEIEDKCKKLKSEKNIKLIIIDYLQLVRKSDKNKVNSEQEILEIYKALKTLTEELDVPVILLSKPSNLRNEPTSLKLYKGNKAEQDIAMFMFLDNSNIKTTDLENIVEINIFKNNNDNIEKINIGYIPKYCKFVELKN